MDIKYLIPHPSETIQHLSIQQLSKKFNVNSDSTIVAKVLRFKNIKKWFSEVKLVEMKMNLILNSWEMRSIIGLATKWLRILSLDGIDKSVN